MHDETIQTLRQGEHEFGCWVLFARELGSRETESLNAVLQTWASEPVISSGINPTASP